MTTRDGDGGDVGPRISADGKLAGGKLKLCDLSDQIQAEPRVYVDRLFDKSGKLCPLNDFELQKFRNQLEKMSNLSDVHNAPMVRSNAQRLPDDSSLSAWKDRILGHENSLETTLLCSRRVSTPSNARGPTRWLRTHHGRARTEEDAKVQRRARRRRQPGQVDERLVQDI